jgi:nitrogen fixation NifU-like protein
MTRSAGGEVALYDPVLMRHARKPYGLGRLEGAVTRCDTNRPCGDRVCFHVRPGPTLAVRFEGEGCALSIGAASALCEAVDGSSLVEARRIAQALLAAVADGAAWESLPGDLAHFAATRDFPARRGCVSLPSLVLLAALDDPPEGEPP